MMLVNLLPDDEQFPSLGSFYCRPCDFSETTPLTLGSAAIVIGGAAERVSSHE
jgi:hypothetical protein